MEQPPMKTPSRRISTSHYPACRSGELRPRGPELVANCDEKHPKPEMQGVSEVEVAPHGTVEEG